MVNSENINDKMFKTTQCLIIILLTLLEVCVRTQMSVRDTTHGFIQNNNEVRYLVDVDDISTIHKQGYGGEVRNPKLQDAIVNSWLRFEPEFLDFKERPLGVPHLEKVTLYNVNSNKSIDMTSISGNTVHFHSSFFEDKVIPPLGNTTFNVVFLGREEGEIESSLFIHTKEGSYKYQVKGSSIASPYRLRPIVDIRVPLNVSFSPLIYMHNPHTYPIQINEVYSSGGDFHLELPTGELEGPPDMWEIPPFQTKPVIRVRFNARVESNYTAYVRIKVNNIDEVLVVPLEVEVSSQYGLFTPQGMVDFGIGGTLDQPRQVKLLVYNTMKKLVRIQSVMTSSKAIKVDFQPIKVLPDMKEPTEIASLTVDWKTAHETKDLFGKIFIKYKQGGKSKLEVPYWVTVYEGGLIYNESETQYLVDRGDVDYSARNFTVTNKYKYPLAINNISLSTEAKEYFTIKNFKSVILKPEESTILFILTLKKKNHMFIDINFHHELFINTNITNIVIPLISYDGRLDVRLPNSDETTKYDLGLMSTESIKEAHFILTNKNPVDLDILYSGTSSLASKVKLVGCGRDNIENDIHFPSTNISKCTNIKSGLYGVFQVTYQSSKREGVINFQVNIQTKHETVSINCKTKISNGKLEIGPERLVFDECFPGKICSHPLRVHSTYTESMIIENIASIPPDPRLSSSFSGHITTKSSKIIGHLFLDPSLSCRQNNNCYTGFPLHTNFGLQWLETLSSPSKIHDFDFTVLSAFYGRYLNATAGKRWHNLTLRLDTNEVKGHFFQTRVKLSWPKLMFSNTPGNRSVVNFPLTQIGHTTYKNITIKNPTDSLIILQLIMDWAYPQTKNTFKNLPNNFCPRSESVYETRNFFFHENHTKNHQEFIKELQPFNIFPPENTVPLILRPRSSADIIIGFKASVSSLRSALMYIRNNLTMLEIVRLTGQGASPSFRFGNRKPGSNLPLLFELTEKHLRDCEKEKNRKNPSPNLTVKRSFIARNTGDVTISVDNFSINGFPCEGYGFKVLNCAPFVLPPNATKKIDIAFTPDFTLSKIQRVLILETSLNIPVNYTLITTLPPYFLAPCSSVLARPPWELIMYYVCVSLMSFLFLIVICVCFIESDRILKSQKIRDEGITQPLDLRSIGAQTRNEYRTPIKSEAETNGWNGMSNGQTNKNMINKSDHKHEMPQCNKSSWTSEQNIKETVKGTDDQKYSIATSTQTKVQKKKLSKKNSSDNTDLDKKNLWNNKVINNNKQNTTEVPESNKKRAPTPLINNNLKIENKKESPIQQKDINNKRHSINKKNNNKNLDTPCSEEETSSTTTESSNNDEILNENQKKDKIRKTKVFKKNNKLQNVTHGCDFRDNYESEVEEDDFEKDNTINKYKQRTETKKESQENSTKQIDNRSTNEKENKRMYKNNRDRKDKKEQKKKEKLSNKNSIDGIGNSSANETCVSPPVPPFGAWGENRATFSDVVARSDSSFYTPIQKRPNNSTSTITPKPILYVGPTKNETKPTPTDLGPIGSKKPENIWSDNSKNFTPQHNPVNKQISNSFFTDPPHGLNIDGQNSYFNNVSNIWNNTQDNSPVDFIQKETNSEDVTPSTLYPANWSSWVPLCAPVGENRSHSYSTNNDYFWSTSNTSSWSSPWSPVNSIAESLQTVDSRPTLPVRSPPGFSCPTETESERQERLQGSFDPFSSLSTIWTHPSQDYWNTNNGSQQ